VCEILKFKLPSSIVTPGYSGYWPGYSGHRVSIFLIWSSGPHNHLNRKSLSPSPSQLTLPLPSRALSPSHSLPHEPSLSLTSTPSSLSPRLQDLQVQVDSKAKGTSIGVENHPLHPFLLGGLRFQLEKVPKLGLNGLIALECFKRFLLGQSSSYESLY